MWLHASLRMKKSPKKSDFVGEAPMILILGHFRINPARFAEAQPVMQQMIDHSRAEAGCIFYHYSVDLADPSIIHVREAWLDNASFTAHVASDHLRHWRDQWPRLGITGRDLHRYEVASAAPC